MSSTEFNSCTAVDPYLYLPTLVSGSGNLWQTLFSERAHVKKELSWEEAVAILIQVLELCIMIKLI